MKNIPVAKPFMGKEECAEVKKVLESRYIGLGPRTEQFENEFAEYVGVKYAVGTNSCTAALHLSLLAHGIGKGDEVILSPFAFVGVPQTVLYVGAKPVFADIEEDTFNIDPVDIEKKITKKTKAIIAVHFAGHAVDLTKINKIAKKYNLIVIEDAAHASGSEYQGKKIGSFNTTCFSFHAVKNLSSPDGGMITTNDKNLAEKLRKLRWMGIDKDTWRRFGKSEGKNDWYYEVKESGWKYHMNDIGAAICSVQLKKLDKMNEQREHLVRLYNLFLNFRTDMILPVEFEYTKSSWYDYIIRVPAKDRDNLHLFLKDNGVNTGVHVMPANWHPLFKKHKEKTPVSDRIWKEVLSLPLYPEMKDDEVRYVTDAIRRFYEAKRS